MKRLPAFVLLAALALGCNNGKKDKQATATNAVPSAPAMPPPIQGIGEGSATFTVEGKQEKVHASILVQKDKDHLSPGNDYFGIITASAPHDESMNVNMMFSLKPGSYPVVGLAFTRKTSADKGEVYGSLLGGKPKIINYKVNITECEKVGANNAGGNKWKISGNIEGAVTIDAMGIMRLDKEHPASIKVDNFSFANLVFDDNWDEMMNRISEGIKNRKK